VHISTKISKFGISAPFLRPTDSHAHVEVY
jgi:hypothetical protein